MLGGAGDQTVPQSERNDFGFGLHLAIADLTMGIYRDIFTRLRRRKRHK